MAKKKISLALPKTKLTTENTTISREEQEALDRWVDQGPTTVFHQEKPLEKKEKESGKPQKMGRIGIVVPEEISTAFKKHCIDKGVNMTKHLIDLIKKDMSL